MVQAGTEFAQDPRVSEDRDKGEAAPFPDLTRLVGEMHSQNELSARALSCTIFHKILWQEGSRFAGDVPSGRHI